ncbi:Argonaute siRNA chaperone complex subunit Arb1-domain-containing protein, partial [Lineolata rhizophorae]
PFQVEYYFSDENLPYDEHLLEKCGGVENKPVRIKHICGFPRMRKFKPFTQVVEALRRSAFLEVCSGNTIRRRVPLLPDMLVHSDDSEVEGGEKDEDKDKDNRKKEEKRGLVPPPKRMNQKTQKDTGMLKGSTGFEEFFAEAPLTPEQVKEESGLYDEKKPITERLEIAIHRYKQKRKFWTFAGQVFNRFLKYGGVEAKERQFTGPMDEVLTQNKDKGEVAQLLATHQLDPELDEADTWVVDFEGVAKGFFSSVYPVFTSSVTPRMTREATGILRNFYNYLMYHDVCPEYADSLVAARRICDLADRELPRVRRAGLRLPGAFNVSCSELHNGYWSGMFVGKDNSFIHGRSDWAEDEAVADRELDEEEGLEDGEETTGAPRVCQALGPIQARELTPMGLEVAHVEMPNERTLRFYEMARLNLRTDFKVGRAMQPVGKLHCRPWTPPAFVKYDLPVEEAAKQDLNSSDELLVFLVETDVLRTCFVGMKLDAVVGRMVNGMPFLDQINNTYASFYTYLPNELLSTPWKAPEMTARARELEMTGPDGEIVKRDEVAGKKGENSDQEDPAKVGGGLDTMAADGLLDLTDQDIGEMYRMPGWERVTE